MSRWVDGTGGGVVMGKVRGRVAELIRIPVPPDTHIFKLHASPHVSHTQVWSTRAVDGVHRFLARTYR